MIDRRAALLGFTAAIACTGAPSRAATAIPAVSSPLPPSSANPLFDASPAAEALHLEDLLAHEVPRSVPRTPARDAEWIALATAEIASATMTVDHPQLLVVVDRNPRIQQLVVMLATPEGPWKVIGGTKVSTGSTGRFDHYITPRGVFHLTTAILGYRAEGTLNENGIRGLGAKGMRVWDFGWQWAHRGWGADQDRTPIRLMMHATDPDKLEQRIGRPASQGCIRIPSAMNRFLDRHGVLDAEYERAAVTDIKFRTLLPRDREPTPLAGNTLVVVDSAEHAGPTLTVASHP